jgi:DNA-binding NarL/FixJ family response regulator
MTGASFREPTDRGSRGRVMIVEDDRVIALHLESMLKAFGYTLCSSAHSAEGALRIAADERPQLVLMDVRLEGAVDGISTAEALHEKLGLRVIYITAHSDAITVARAKLTRPYGYVLKPVREADLRCCLELAFHEAQRVASASPSGAPPSERPSNPELLAPLSGREVEVLTLLALGHTSKSIAATLNIAKPTVDTYRARLADKLGVRSRSELVTIATRAGLLTKA